MTSPVVVESQRIDMTSPVVVQRADQAKRVISFIMPSKYKTIDQLPVPSDDVVSFKLVPERTLAVIKFSGSASKSLFEEKEAELRKECLQDGIKLGKKGFVTLTRRQRSP